MQLRFYKDSGGWFLDNEDYINLGGLKADLQMVSGADALLEFLDAHLVNWMYGPVITTGRGEVILQVDKEPFVGAVLLMRLPNEGWYTQLTDGHLLWLCPVTKWIFNGEYPDFIYYKKL